MSIKAMDIATVSKSCLFVALAQYCRPGREPNKGSFGRYEHRARPQGKQKNGRREQNLWPPLTSKGTTLVRQCCILGIEVCTTALLVRHSYSNPLADYISVATQPAGPRTTNALAILYHILDRTRVP
jgi:hypothetical protein